MAGTCTPVITLSCPEGIKGADTDQACIGVKVKVDLDKSHRQFSDRVMSVSTRVVEQSGRGIEQSRNDGDKRYRRRVDCWRKQKAHRTDETRRLGGNPETGERKPSTS